MNKKFPRLRQQGPRYYYDHGIVNGKRRWEPLGKDWQRVMTRYQELEGTTTQAAGNTVGLGIPTPGRPRGICASRRLFTRLRG